MDLKALLQQAWADNDRLRAENARLTAQLEMASVGTLMMLRGTGMIPIPANP